MEVFVYMSVLVICSYIFKIYDLFLLYVESYSIVKIFWSLFGIIFDEMVLNCVNYLVIIFLKFVIFFRGL